jgi:hypothetical protein
MKKIISIFFNQTGGARSETGFSGHGWHFKPEQGAAFAAMIKKNRCRAFGPAAVSQG